MKRVKHALAWCLLLEKRFLKTPAILGMLLLVPLLALGLYAAAGREGGAISVALCPGDALSEEIAEALAAEGGVLRCILCDSAEQARALVATGKADAAWIFAENTAQALERYAAGHSAAAVTVVEREDSVFLMLAREKLYAALYPALSRSLYARFLQEREGGGYDAAAAMERYGRTPLRREIVVTGYADGTAFRAEGYLLSPMRGMLALGVMLSSLAAAALLAGDLRRGALVWLRPGGRAAASAAYLLLPALTLGLAALGALWLSGLFTAAGYEALLMLLLSLSSAGLAAVVGLLCRTPARIGAAALALCVAALALCPIFFSVNLLRPLAMALPPWWYLRALHDPALLGGMLCCCAVTWACAAALAALLRIPGRE